MTADAERRRGPRRRAADRVRLLALVLGGAGLLWLALRPCRGRLGPVGLALMLLLPAPAAAPDNATSGGPRIGRPGAPGGREPGDRRLDGAPVAAAGL